MEYIHVPDLAPTKDILDAYKKRKGDWGHYERRFFDLIAERRIEGNHIAGVTRWRMSLCSEETPRQCHRRLVAEYLREKWGDVEIEHIL
jgi:uncharacterized protein YeaO (DUF488 family)